LEWARAECAKLREENEELKKRLLIAKKWSTLINPVESLSSKAIPNVAELNIAFRQRPCLVIL